MLGETGIIALLAIWGAGALCFYGICVAHAIDRTPGGQVAQVTSGLLFVWAAGSIFGPLLSGLALKLAGGFGLFGLAGVCLAAMTFYMLVRARLRPSAVLTPQGERGAMLPSPLASVEIVPKEPGPAE